MTTRPKIKVASIINGKYLAFRKLGEGGCGVIYEVALVKCPQKRFACKAETTVPDEDPTLPMEHKVITLMNERNSQHAVELLEKGKGENYQFLVMTLLGPSLDAIRAALPLKRFSTFSTLVMVVQALDSLKEVHDIGYIHRDVKPANFAIGALGTQKQRLLHVLDFGIARQYVAHDAAGRTKMRRPRRIVPFRGTLRYCSVATQERKEQGRQDDLWSLFYMLVEFLKGSLPWAGLSDEEELRKLKSDMHELTNGLDDEFVLFSKHLEILGYSSTPDYEILRKLLLNVFVRRKFTADMKVDWEHGGRYDRCFEKKTATLPKVTENDMGVVDLAKMLIVPEKESKITLEDVLSRDKMEVSPVNSCNDDTLEENDAAAGGSTAKKAASRSKNLATSFKSTKSTKKYKGYKAAATPRKIPVCVMTTQKVAQEESRWKKKQEEELRDRLAKKAAAARRAKRDVVVPEDMATELTKVKMRQNKAK